MRVAVRRLRSALRMFPQTKAYDLRSCCDAARLESLDESGRHRLRVRIKRARYAAEFFSALYPRAAVRPYVAALSGLQDCLGSLTDINMARAVLRDFELGGEIEQRLLGAWTARATDAAQSLASGFAAAARCASLWKRQPGRRTHV